MSSHVDRFYAAVTVLAGDGHIKQRLAEAVCQHIVGIHGSELPPDLRERYAELRCRLYSATPVNGEDPILASVRKMSGADAAECSAILVDLYRELLTSGTELREREKEEQRSSVPAFLVKSASA